jgi:hypothetical protein
MRSDIKTLLLHCPADLIAQLDRHVGIRETTDAATGVTIKRRVTRKELILNAITAYLVRLEQDDQASRRTGTFLASRDAEYRRQNVVR